MKYIDMENWNRKEHFKFFKQMDYPHFNICANLDLTKFYKYIKENGMPFFIPYLYASTKAANNVKEFRYRIREDKVVEHEVVNPSFTIMAENEIFSFCAGKYFSKFGDFKIHTLKKMDEIKNNVNLEDEPGQDDLLFITSIPWVSFTSFIHPIHMNPVDCIPRLSWGKYFEENGKIKIPMSVQAHHALVDGLHVGRYFNILQDILDNPEKHY